MYIKENLWVSLLNPIILEIPTPKHKKIIQIILEFLASITKSYRFISTETHASFVKTIDQSLIEPIDQIPLPS